MRPDSDVDVAVVPTGAAPAAGWAFFGFPEDLAERLGNWHRHPFHVTVLHATQPIWSMSALKEARLACVRDQEALAGFLEDVANRYRIDGWRNWRAVEEVAQ